jgi:hypothetical protein
MQLLPIARGEGEIRIFCGESDDLFAEGRLIGIGCALGEKVEIGGCIGEELAVVSLGTQRDLTQHSGAREESKGDVLGLTRRAGCVRSILGDDPFLQVGAPGCEVIDPRVDGVEPVAELVYGKGCGPEVVGESSQRDGAPVVFAGVPIQKPRRDMIVTIAKDRCRYGNGVAEDPFGRVTAAVDLRLNFFDHDASAAFNRFHITQIFPIRLYTYIVRMVVRLFE